MVHLEKTRHYGIEYEKLKTESLIKDINCKIYFHIFGMEKVIKMSGVRKIAKHRRINVRMCQSFIGKLITVFTI